ncbi:MAG: hypothetical protein U0572_01130 [Phycisphaerales bacterium]
MAEAPTGNPKKSPASLDVDDVVRLLRASGSRHASADRVRADIDAGAPTNADGTVHLVHYGAWLARQVVAGEAGGVV